ncbi:MAG: sigma factor-like helix-turn-helix DNA-binding protein [Myxococcaceae bacterium]
MLAALASLDVRRRKALRLRYVEERKLEEVGLALGVSVPQAHKLIREGLERVREYLAAVT